MRVQARPHSRHVPIATAVVVATAGAAAAGPVAPPPPSSSALVPGATPPLDDEDGRFRPRSDDAMVVVARAALVAVSSERDADVDDEDREGTSETGAGIDLDVELRLLEAVGVGAGVLVSGPRSVGYLRLSCFGVAVDHVAASMFLDFILDDSTDFRLGGALSLPLYRMGVAADLAVYLGASWWPGADTSDLAAGLEYALW